MRYYETVVIIHPALEGGMLKDNIIEVQKLVEQKGGELKNTEVWGRKKLAYLIDKQKYGTYTMLQYTGEIIKINEMNVEMEHNPNILAYMTIKIDESEIKEQTSDLDAQIDGQASQNEEEKAEPAATQVEKEDEIPEVSEDEIKAILEDEGDDLSEKEQPEDDNAEEDESEESQDKEN